VVSEQGQHEVQLGVHPTLLQPGGIHAQQAHGAHHRHHHAGGCDDVGQAPLHQGVLVFKGLAQGWLQLGGLAVINEQAHQVEEPSEPHHHPHDVQGLEP
jgi:hypothetical protein